MNNVFQETLVPGRVLALSLKDPKTKTKLLAAGTVLTSDLIDQIHKADLASSAALCLSDEIRDLPDQGPSASTAPSQPIDFRRRRRLHASMDGLRTLWIVGALGAAAFSILTGDTRDARIAIAAAVMVFISYLASFGMVRQTRTLFAQSSGTITELSPREPESIEAIGA
ncbi:MAG: hypothetical protein KGR26_03635 [Cyanobacteria bacterium REEB65]|nr:hypothetical protein [Cyanobacteria bacterium REEB65]